MIFALVETGDLLGAQKLILGELSTQFGGSATAAAGTYAGKMAKLSNAFGDLGEKLGEKLAPELILIIRFLQEAIDTAQRLGILHVGAKKEVEPEMRKARLQDEKPWTGGSTASSANENFKSESSSTSR